VSFRAEPVATLAAHHPEAMTARRPVAATARADVPNKVIQGWQDSALESLRLTVLSKQETSAARPWVAGGGSVTTTEGTLTAKVDEVHRTASGVAPARSLPVRYGITRY
jgi:hypothetical protein